jgi:Ribophorin I
VLREVEVSHWGGNVAVEELYDLTHHGAKLKVRTVHSNGNTQLQSNFKRLNCCPLAPDSVRRPLHKVYKHASVVRTDTC